MHSKQGYKICICPVILAQLEPFWIDKRLSIISRKIIDAIYNLTKIRNFPHHIFESEILSFLFVRVIGKRQEWNL